MEPAKKAFNPYSPAGQQKQTFLELSFTCTCGLAINSSKICRLPNTIAYFNPLRTYRMVNQRRNAYKNILTCFGETNSWSSSILVICTTSSSLLRPHFAMEANKYLALLLCCVAIPFSKSNRTISALQIPTAASMQHQYCA